MGLSPPPRRAEDAPPLELLGAVGAPRVVVIPLVAAGGCFGALLAAGPEDETGDVALLSRFVMEASPPLWEALGRERRRQEALQARGAP